MAATRLQIRNRARTRADQEPDSHPTDAEGDPLIDEAGQEVWFDLYLAGFPLKRTVETITADGSDDYPLNSSNPVMTVEGVFLNIGGDVVPLRRADRSDDGSLRTLSAASNLNLPGWYEIALDPAVGLRIQFWPKPVGGTYRVEYVREWPGFSGDADVWRGPARSDELVVLKTAAKFLRAEGERADASDLDAEYEKLAAKVARAASMAYGRDPARIRDVAGGTVRDAFDYDVVGPYRDRY